MYLQKMSTEAHRRRGLMSDKLYKLFVRYITTKKMPTDKELTVAKFEKACDNRQPSQRCAGPDKAPNSKTAAKFRQWAKSFKV